MPYKIFGVLSFLIARLFFTLPWSTLRDIEHNKVIRSTYVWLFIVPITAKFLSKLESNLSFEISGQMITFVLSMPFSWQALFFSACFFVIGNILVSLQIPEIIKKYKNFSDFSTSGKTREHLRNIQGDRANDSLESIKTLKKLAGISSSSDSEDDFKNNFDSTYLSIDYGNVLKRAICSLCYLFGMLFILDVAYKNFLWVISSMDLVEFKDKLFFGSIIDFFVGAF